MEEAVNCAICHKPIRDHQAATGWWGAEPAKIRHGERALAPVRATVDRAARPLLLLVMAQILSDTLR